ncbi:recQ-mediated genome instability protein 1 [Osmerus eperlanus]|uniref:recQ-mediated genome instability protein 1 n=1 Tax=Osmerus eperlanus TaxID=29151 RepID=UPI002E0DD9A8
MRPPAQGAVQAAQTWLKSSWQVQVPFTWLEACVEWLQEEGGGQRVSQHQLNQQVLDQWLLTDLRDLAHPVLPEGLSRAQNTELRGSFCVQADSLLDVSQPAYTQLQRAKGTDCTNEGVSAVTQITQRPWEAKPTRMLYLQITDGVQSLEAMEYQPIPALGALLRPGVKLQLHGQMVCRLGVLLLGPGNVTVLGGEVEELAERNSLARVLCRALGQPEEEPPQRGAGEQENHPLAGNQQEPEVDEMDDQELLASLDAQEERGEQQAGWRNQEERGAEWRQQPSLESGYGTHSDASSRSASVVSQSSNQASIPYGRPSFQSHRSESQADSAVGSHPSRAPDWVDDHPDEDFDDIPLEELDFQDSPARPTPPAGTNPRTSSIAGHARGSGSGSPGVRNDEHLESFNESTDFLDERDDFMDEDLDSLFPPEPEHPREDLTLEGTRTPQTSSLTPQASGPGPQTSRPPELGGDWINPQPTALDSITANPEHVEQTDPEGEGHVTLDSPPFTYLCLLEGEGSGDAASSVPAREVRVKAFIVTLLGNLQAKSGEWRVGASISDGSAYLDVELSDRVVTGLLGFSVAQKAALKRDPVRRVELAAGMKACQEGLVDMCCIMTLAFSAGGGRPVVTRTDDVTDGDCRVLERRVRGV